MQKRKVTRSRAGEVNLPELLDHLEQALTEIPPRTSVFRALSVLNRRLGTTNQKTGARKSRSRVSRHPPVTATESFPLFS
jgi:hypothetical protein